MNDHFASQPSIQSELNSCFSAPTVASLITKVELILYSANSWYDPEVGTVSDFEAVDWSWITYDKTEVSTRLIIIFNNR